MSYQVLARRCRPQTFEDVIGQKHVTQTLKNAIREKRIAHAYLFTGERGVGKTSIARIMAKALNCEKGPTDQPCNQCASCREITAGNSIDVHEIDGASNTSVDDVRTLRENVRYMPSRDRYKVYIIDEVHMLSKPAFNALLKTLEEPPAHIIFMFATTEPEKIPDTIISRCLRFDFRRISTQDIIAHLETLLKSENISISRRGLYLIARAAEGSMRDAQSLLDRILAYSRGDISDAEVEELLGRVDRSMLYRITEAVLSEDPQGCLQALNTLYDSGVEVRQFYYAYLEHLRDLMLAKMSKAPAALLDIPEEDAQEIMRLADRATAEDLRSYFRLWFFSEEEINRSALPKIALEMCCLEMVNVKKSIPIDDVLKKLDDLQHKLGGKVGSVAPPPQYASGADAPAVVKEPARSLREKPAPYTPSPADAAAVTPARSDGEKDAAGFLAYIRQKDLPLASQLEHGNISMSDKNEIIIELPGNSFFLDNIKDGNTGKKISAYGEEFFKCTMAVRVVTGEHTAPEDHEQKKNLERKKKQQEALHNPLIQKILETFDGKIIEVKTEL